MTQPRDGRVLQEERRMLQEQGFESVLQLRTLPRRPWYRQDGTLVGVLPVDEYATQLYWGKGWTLKPPEASEDKEE